MIRTPMVLASVRLSEIRKARRLSKRSSLNNNLLMEGCARPLIVKFADNKHQRSNAKSGMYEDKRSWSIWEAYTSYSSPQVPAAYAPQGASSDGHAWASSAQDLLPLPPHQYGPGTYGPGAQQIHGHLAWPWCTASCNNHPTCIHRTRTLHRLSMPLLLLLNRKRGSKRIRVPVKVLLVQISLFTICPTT
jgi:hypothetical protein